MRLLRILIGLDLVFNIFHFDCITNDMFDFEYLLISYITNIVYPSIFQHIHTHPTPNPLCKLALGYTKLLVIIFGLKTAWAASIYIRDTSITPHSVYILNASAFN